MILYLIYLELIEKGISHNSIYGVSPSFRHAKEIVLKYYHADFNTITKKNGKKIPYFHPLIEMWDTLADRDGGDIIGRFIYNKKLKIFEFEEDD